MNHDGTLNSWLDVSGHTNTVVYGFTAPYRPYWFSTTNANAHPAVRFFGSNFFGIQFSPSVTNWTTPEAFLVLKARTNAPPGSGPGHWRFGNSLAYYPGGPAGTL